MALKTSFEVVEKCITTILSFSKVSSAYSRYFVHFEVYFKLSSLIGSNSCCVTDVYFSEDSCLSHCSKSEVSHEVKGHCCSSDFVNVWCCLLSAI